MLSAVGGNKAFEPSGKLRAVLQHGAKTVDLVDIQVLYCLLDGVLPHGSSRNWQGTADLHSTGPRAWRDEKAWADTGYRTKAIDHGAASASTPRSSNATQASKDSR
ncbi:hypothetical protein [Streptomyces sp. NPDC091299]|uniref:hypothetical protein n=1 Tax=Streptomyces sp. NPDC091299 TaxID=3155302 RepID=UPI00343784B8